MYKIYLAGKMTGMSTQEANEWRVEIEALLQDRAEDYDLEIKVINPVEYFNFNNFNEYNKKFRGMANDVIRDWDLDHVISSDLIIVNLNHPNSEGTTSEVTIADYCHGIPVIGFGMTVNHPWVHVATKGKEFKTMEQAVDYIAEFYFR